MIQKTNDNSIIDIFKPYKEIRWIIPKYQREYEWKKSHCEDLFIDLYDNDKGYFLGTILCVEVESEKILSQEFEIIDGQQRLASLSLLYIAIYKQLDHLIKKKFPKPDVNNKEFLDLTLEKKNIKNMIILNDEKKIYIVENSSEHNILAKSKSELQQFLKFLNNYYPFKASIASAGSSYRITISSFLIENKYFDPEKAKGKEFWIYFVEDI